MLIEHIAGDSLLHDAFLEGKMLGVMLVEGEDGLIHRLSDGTGVLWAFSGNVTLTDEHMRSRQTNHLDGFVPPVFDLLDPDGHFKRKESEISLLNLAIYKMEKAGGGQAELQAMKARRKELSEYLQKWIFDQFVILNAAGEKRSLTEIFSEQGMIPPGGTGECALPKMLQYAYSRKLRPLAFGEFWYGASNGREVRTQGSFYPSCTGKCGPLLPYMLKGLELEDNPLAAAPKAKPVIIYEDSELIVADKPSGMLSVPGKGAGESLLEWLQRRANRLAGASPKQGPKVYAVHRLDMDTSGLMVFAKSLASQAELRRLFEEKTVSAGEGQVQKSYLALVTPQGMVCGRGRIELPLAADYYDRPRQIVDHDGGKPAVTEYELVEFRENGDVLLKLWPLTGRTHQLRVHCAHSDGLAAPIAGDRLYGGREHPRLCLMAQSLSFIHPVTGKKLSFELDPTSF